VIESKILQQWFAPIHRTTKFRMRPHFNLNSIVTFLAVAQAGSFREASESMHTSASAVSARIKQLETRLGVRLFHRTTRSVCLTDAGQRLLAAGLRACSELSSVEQALLQEASLQRGEVTLAVVPSLAQAEVPGILKDFGTLHPGVQLRLLDVDSLRSLEMLGRGEVDLAIVSETGDQPGIVFEPLYWDECYLVAPQGHPLSRGKPVALRQLRDYPLMVNPKGTTLRQVLEQSFSRAGLTLTAAQQIANIPTMIRMVEAGFGLGIAPAKGLRSIAPGGCVLLSLKESVGWTVGIARLAGRSESPACIALRALLLAHYRQSSTANPELRRRVRSAPSGR